MQKLLSSRKVEGLQFSGGRFRSKLNLTAQSLVLIHPESNLPIVPNSLFSLFPKDKLSSTNNYNLNNNNMYQLHTLCQELALVLHVYNFIPSHNNLMKEVSQASQFRRDQEYSGWYGHRQYLNLKCKVVTSVQESCSNPSS